MFYEFQNISYSGTGIQSDNIDFTLSGTSKKLELNTDETIIISFDAVDLSSYDEITIQIYTSPNKFTQNLFSIIIDGNEYIFDQQPKKYNHIIFDCADLTNLSSITIKGKVDDLVLFFDLLGYRKVLLSDMDKDVIKALASHISLDYGVQTALSEDVSAGDTEIKLDSYSYINDNCILLIDDIEEVELDRKYGLLKEPIGNSYLSGTTVKVLCPVVFGNQKEIDKNPVCGILIYDRITNKQYYFVRMSNLVGKEKLYLGDIFIQIYLECSSDNKLMYLARQFEYKYGSAFNFILDGQVVEIRAVDDGTFTPELIGNFPRMSYRYSFNPQPVTKVSRNAITTINYTGSSTPYEP